MTSAGFFSASAKRGLLKILIIILTIVAILPIARNSSAENPGAVAISRLQEAIKLYPDDPDLAWSLTRKLVHVGRTADAVQQARGFLTRWPERRPDARIELARSMLDAGDTAQALIFLDEQLRLDPRSGIAHFYRAIAFRADGLIPESNREFRVASRLEPTLRAESLLGLALGLFELGREDEAVDLLRQILEIDPASESAIRARLMLRQREMLSMQRRWRLDAHAGFEWDSNVLLESATNESVGTDQEDFRGVWGLGATVRALTTEKADVTLGYRFDQSKHDDLGRFDLLTNSGFASGSLQLSPNVILRMDGIAWNTRQSGHNELTAGTLRPNLIVALGPSRGAIRAFAQYEIFEYDTPALITSWERDGFSLGGGVEYFLPLPIKQSFLSTSISYQTNLTQAKSTGSPDGFDGDYDYDSAKLRSQARLTLPGEIRAGLEAAYSYDRYHNVNFLNALGTLQISKRRDDILSGRITLSRELVSHAELEVYWRGTWRMSNVSFFDYDQQVVGAVLRVSTD
jgi:tetratricopeptide (TPR) repeat protein